MKDLELVEPLQSGFYAQVSLAIQHYEVRELTFAQGCL